MGAWSHEPFGNDEANDWAYELEETEDLSHVEAALDTVLKTAGYLEASEASCGVAAVEVIAKILGRGTQSELTQRKSITGQRIFAPNLRLPSWRRLNACSTEFAGSSQSSASSGTKATHLSGKHHSIRCARRSAPEAALEF